MSSPTSKVIIIESDVKDSSFIEMMNGISIKISSDSANYINPFDYDLSLLNDEKVDVISDKCQLITALISMNRHLSMPEISFIDHCVRQTYMRSKHFKKGKMSDMPIFSHLYDYMKAKTDFSYIDECTRYSLCNALDTFITGSLISFNNYTNIYTPKINDSNCILYDIDISMSDAEKAQAEFLVLDSVYNQVSANRNKNVSTLICFNTNHANKESVLSTQYIQKIKERMMSFKCSMWDSIKNSYDSSDFDFPLLNYQ